MKVAKEKASLEITVLNFSLCKFQNMVKYFSKKWSKCKNIFCKEILWKSDDLFFKYITLHGPIFF